jgi:hypothetical protein
MTREDYLMAQAFVLAIEVLSTQPGALRQDNNIREMKDCLDRLAVPSNLIAHLQSQARAQIDRLTPRALEVVHVVIGPGGFMLGGACPSRGNICDRAESMDGSEVRRIHEALGQAIGREVLQLDLGVMLGLNLASVEVGKWETEGASGPEAVAPSYLSQGLPGFRGDIPEWSYQQAFHAKAVRGLQILTPYWWLIMTRPVPWPSALGPSPSTGRLAILPTGTEGLRRL